MIRDRGGCGLVGKREHSFEQHEAAEKDARGFAAGERFDGLGRVIAAEEHLTEKATQSLLAREWIELREPIRSRSCWKFCPKSCSCAK